MHVMMEPELLERTVFHAVHAETALTGEYQRAFAACYREASGDRRDRAFAGLHDHWFDRLGLRQRILDRLSEFALVACKVGRFAVVDARSRVRSGAELFGKEGRLALVLAITPTLLLDVPAFDAWVRFELQHIEDMLNPEFGYDADCRPGGENPAKTNLAHDRFVILWALSVDARLSRREGASTCSQQTRFEEFIRAFRLPDDECARASFLRLWDHEFSVTPRHATLVAWAENGIPGVPTMAGGHGEGNIPAPGAGCPLCGFSTFDWTSSSADLEKLQPSIQAAFPAWTPRQAICKRCEEVYRVHENSNSMSARPLANLQNA